MMRIWWIVALLAARTACAGEVAVAVAANVAAPMQQIAADFERSTGHKAILTNGATGKFYAQIVNGAPFDVLLSADDETPLRMEQEGRTVTGTRFTYAIGRLVLWSAQPGVVDDAGRVLEKNDFRHLAIANPRLAPYGQAAIQALIRLNLLERWQSKFVQGENIAQTYQFVISGNAELGFVALSQVMRDGRLIAGSGWIVPERWHEPLRQDAVLLKHGADNAAAQALLAYLRSNAVKSVLRSYGYGF